MKYRHMLTKSIDKAMKKGYVLDVDKFYHLLDEIKRNPKNVMYYEFIFSHDFAKAFWGENYAVKEIGKKGIVGYDKPNKNRIPYWQNCLQDMVICVEPLKYLEKFL